MMMAGKLDTIIGIYRVQPNSPDSLWGDQAKESFSLINNVWAQVRSMSASERTLNDGTISNVAWQIRIRPTDINEKDQIRFAYRILNIVAITEYPDAYVISASEESN